MLPSLGAGRVVWRGTVARAALLLPCLHAVPTPRGGGRGGGGTPLLLHLLLLQESRLAGAPFKGPGAGHALRAHHTLSWNPTLKLTPRIDCYVSVPTRLGKGQGAKEIGHILRANAQNFRHNLGTILCAIDENMDTNLQALYNSSAVWKHKNRNYT